MMRRSHRKSRFGCKRCKLRKVKCDERRPGCGNCDRMRVPCDFTTTEALCMAHAIKRLPLTPLDQSLYQNDHFETSDHNQPYSSRSLYESLPANQPGQIDFEPSLPEQVDSTCPRSMNSSSERLLELRLFHHYIEIAATSFPDMPQNPQQAIAQDAWSNWAVNLAFNNHTVMDALLGFSAFHLRLSSSSDKNVSEASHKYMSRAIIGHAREVRGGVHAGNVDALLTTSTYIAFHAATNQQLLADNNGLQSQFSLLHWFHPWRGLKALLAASSPYIRSEHIVNLMADRKSIENDSESASDEQRNKFRRFGFLLSDLRRDSLDPDCCDAYESSVAHLERIYESPVVHSVLGFTVAVSDKFVELVSVLDPRALTIVGYFFLLVNRLNGIRWLEGTASREFKSLMQHIPKEWKQRMDWAVADFENGRL